MVTSEYHAFRTRLIFDRCIEPNVDVNVVFADAQMSPLDWLSHIVYEQVAYKSSARNHGWLLSAEVACTLGPFDSLSTPGWEE